MVAPDHIPVNRPRRPPSWPGHGRALELASKPANPVWPGLPGFCVLDHDAGVDFVQPIYQHVGHDGNMDKYMYDLIPDAHWAGSSVEVEIGGELGATYTSFYSVDHDTPASMEMPHLVHG